MTSQNFAVTLRFVGTDWKALGTRLRYQRERLDLSREDIHRQAGISVSWLATLEAGGRNYKGAWIDPSPGQRKLIALARVLDLDAAELLTSAGLTVPPWLEDPSTDHDETAAEAIELDTDHFLALFELAQQALERGTPDMRRRAMDVIAMMQRVAQEQGVPLPEVPLSPPLLLAAADNPGDRSASPAPSVRSKAASLARRKGSRGDPV